MENLVSNRTLSITEVDRNFKLKYYSFLKDARIVSVEIFQDDMFNGPDKNWPVITIEKDGSFYELQISKDSEGNGPGYIFGIPNV